MARALVYDYTFTPSAKQVSLRGNIIHDRLLIITNVTTGDVIYNFADPSLGLTDRTYSSSSESTIFTLAFDTTSMSSSDRLSIFIDNPALPIEPSPTYTDPVSKFRVSEPETLIDTDFEYGLQPTKWETLELVNNTPSFFSRTNDTTIPNIQDISTLAGSKIVTVTCSAPHGLTSGIPIDVRGTREVTCDGTYIIDSVPSNTVFKYLAKVKQSISKSIYDIYCNINIGQFFTGSNIQLSNVEGIITDASSTNGVSTLTLKTDYPHGFGINTPLYVLNLNTSITKNFDGSNSGTIKTFDGQEATTQASLDGSNSVNLDVVDASNTKLQLKNINNNLGGSQERVFNAENGQTGGIISYTVIRNADKTYRSNDGSISTIGSVTAGSGFTGNGIGVSPSGGSGSQLKVNYEIRGVINTTGGIGTIQPGSGYTTNYTNLALTGGSGTGATANITTRGNASTLTLNTSGSGYLVNGTAISTTTTSGSGSGMTVNFTANGTTGNQSVPAVPGTAGVNVPANVSTTSVSIVPSSAGFTVTFSGTDIWPTNTYFSLSGVTPSIYNGRWLISSSSAGSVTTTTSFSTSNWVSATVQGTLVFFGDKTNVATTTTSGGSPSGLTVDYFVNSPVSGISINSVSSGYTAGTGVALNNVSGRIRSVGTITPGSGYSSGGSAVYYNVPLVVSSGTGSGATANITVTSGAVTAVDIINPGTGYGGTTVLTADNSNLGNSGSGFSFVVGTICGTGATATTLVSSTGVSATTFGGTAGTFSAGSGATYDGVFPECNLSYATAAGAVTSWVGNASTTAYVGAQTLSTILPGMWVTGTSIPASTYVVSTTAATNPTISSITSNLTAFTGTGFIGNGAASPAAGTTLSITGVTSGSLAVNSYLWGSTVTSGTRITSVNTDTFTGAIGNGTLDGVTAGTVLSITGTVPGTFTDALAPGRILSGSGVTANTMITAVNTATFAATITQNVYIGSTPSTVLGPNGITGTISAGMVVSGGTVALGTTATTGLINNTFTGSVANGGNTMSVTVAPVGAQVVIGAKLVGAVAATQVVTAQLTATNASATTGITASGTSGTNTITVSSNTGIVVGQFVQPITGVPTNTYVSNINGTTITLTNNLSGNLSSAAINFYTAGQTGTYSVSATNASGAAQAVTSQNYVLVNTAQTVAQTAGLTGKSYTVDTSQAVANATSITGLNYTVNTSQLASSKGTPTTIKSSGITQPVGFIVTHNGGTLTPNTFIGLSGVTSTSYNQVWLITSSTTTNFYVQNYADYGDATVVGTLSVGGYVTLSAAASAQIGTSGGVGASLTFSSGTAGGTGAQATITVSGGVVTAVTITNPGTLYNATAGTASVLTTTSLAGLTGFTTRVSTLTTNSVYSATLVSGGTGYRVGDLLRVQTGNCAILVTAVNSTGSVVNSVRHNTSGSGYDHASTSTITAGATTNPTFTLGALSTGIIRTFSVNGIGSNYSVGDTFTVSGAGTTAATGTIASITGGFVGAVTITNGGSNYKLGDVLTIPNGGSTTNGNITSTATNFTVTHSGNFLVTPGSFVTITGTSPTVAGYLRTWRVDTVPNNTSFTVASTLNLGAANVVSVTYGASVPVTALVSSSATIDTATVTVATGVPNSFSVSGTGLGTNSYNNVAATGGTGTGATFNVRCVNGVYTVTQKTFGSGYVPGDTLTISGALLGGFTTANDITITINSVNSNGFGYSTGNSLTIGGSVTSSTASVTAIKQTTLNQSSIAGTVMTMSEAHGYATDAVFVMEYTTLGTQVTNLTVGSSYWVRAISTNSVSFFASYANASANTTPIAIAAGARTAVFTIKQVNQTTEEAIRVVGHGFSVGDMVAYSNGGGTSITGLTTAGYYWIKAVYGTDFFSLSSTPGPAAIQSGAAVVDITGVGVGQTHVFFSTNVDLTNNYIYNPSQHGLTDNTPYYFTQTSATTLNGMTGSKTYYIRNQDVYRYYFVPTFNSTTSTDITSVTNGGTFGIAPAAVDNINNEFWIPGHGLFDEQSITYSTNGGNVVGGLTNNTQYYARVIDANRFYLVSGTGASNSTTRITITGPAATGLVASQSEKFINNTANPSRNTIWIPKHRYNSAVTLTSTAVTSDTTGLTVTTLPTVATTSITSTAASFIVSHNAYTPSIVVGDWVAISGVTPAGYNGSWRVAAVGVNQFTVYSPINLGTATVQGTVRKERTFDQGEWVNLSGMSGAVGGLYNGDWSIDTIPSDTSFKILAPFNLGASSTQATITLNDIGKPVLYSSGTDTPIGGLTNNTIYYIRTVTNQNEIQLSATPSGAVIDITSTGINSTQHSLKRVNFVSTSVGATASGDSSDYFYIPNHGFTTADKINYDTGVTTLRVTSVTSGIVTGLAIVKRGIKLTSTTYTNLTSTNGFGLNITVTTGIDGRLASIVSIDNGGTLFSVNDIIYVGSFAPSFPSGLADLSSQTSLTPTVYYAKSLDTNRLQISTNSAGTTALALGTPGVGTNHVITRATVSYADDIITTSSTHGFIVNDPVMYTAGGFPTSATVLSGGTTNYTTNTLSSVVGGSGTGLYINVVCSVSPGPITSVTLPATTAITSTASAFTVSVTGLPALPVGSGVLIQGVTPAAYNGRWIVASSAVGSFTVNSAINAGTATVQGTVSTGFGYKQGDVVYVNAGTTSSNQTGTVTISAVSTGSPITGLVDGSVYYIKSVPTTTTFTLSASQGGDRVNITDYGNSFPHAFRKCIVDDVNNAFYIPQHGFITNQPVTYSKSTAVSTIRGLTDAQIYYVNRIDENKFSLLSNKSSLGGTTVDINGAGSTAFASTHRFTSTPVLTALNQIWIPNHGFTTTDPITYNTGGGTAIATSGSVVSNLGVYFAIKIDGDYVSLALSSAFAEAGTAIDITGAGSGTAHNFISSASKPDGIYRVTGLPVSTVYREPEKMTALAAGVIPATVKTIDPRQVVDPDRDLIRLTAHGFTTGTTITYSNNGNTSINGLTHNTVYYVIAVNRDFIRLATSSSDAFAGIYANITGWGSGSTHFLTTYQINGEITATGTVSTTTGSAVLTGSNTLFTRYLKVGDDIKIYPSDISTSFTATSITTGSTGANPGTINLTGVPPQLTAVGQVIAFLYNVTGGNAITGLTSGYWYFARVTSVTTNASFSLYTTSADASSNINGIILTATLPTGTHTFSYTTPTSPILRTITAIASDVSLTVDTAYVDTFTAIGYTFPTFIYVRPEGYNLHRPYDGGVEMNTGSSTSDGNTNYVTGNCSIIRQTRKYFRYQSGKGIQVSFGINFQPSTDISLLTSNNLLATATCRKPHGLTQGSTVTISEGLDVNGLSSTPYNGSFTINLDSDERKFTFSIPSNPSTSTVTAIINNNTFHTGSLSHPYYEGQPITFATTTNGVTANTTYYVASVGNDGAVLDTQNNTFQIALTGGTVSNTSSLNGGSGYTGGTGVITSGGSGTGLTINTTVTSGVITAVAINNGGNGYKVGDIIYIGGTYTTQATFTVATVVNGSVIGSLTNGTGLSLSVSSRLGTCFGYPKFFVNTWSNARNRAGLFDSQNGMFFEYDGSQLYCVRRSSTQQLSGTLSVLKNSNLVIGDSTLFSKQLVNGDKIVIRGQVYKVTYIISDTQMTISPAYRGNNGTTIQFDSTLYKGASSVGLPTFTIPAGTTIGIAGVTTSTTYNGVWTVASSSANSITVNATGVSGTITSANSGTLISHFGSFPIDTGSVTGNTFTVTFVTGGKGYAAANTKFTNTAITSTATTFTVTTSAATFTVGQYVNISGASPAAYNGTWRITTGGTNTYTVTSNINPGTAATRGTSTLVAPVISRVPYKSNGDPFTATSYGAGYTLSATDSGTIVNVATTDNGPGTGLVVAGIGGAGAATWTIRSGGSGYTNGTYNNVPVLQAGEQVKTGSFALALGTTTYTLPNVTGLYPGMYIAVTGGTGAISNSTRIASVNVGTSQITLTAAPTTAGTATSLTFWSGRQARVQATVNVTVAGNAITAITSSSVNANGIGYSITAAGAYTATSQTWTGISSVYIPASSIGGTVTNPAGFEVLTQTTGKIEKISVYDMGELATNGGYAVNDTITVTGGTTSATFTVNSIGSVGDTTPVDINPSNLALNTSLIATTTGANTTSLSTPTILDAGRGYAVNDIVWVAGTHTVGNQALLQILSNKTNVDIINDTFTIVAHGLTSGQAILYNAGDGNPVGGLLTGNIYYVVYKSIDQFQLSSSINSIIPINLTSFGSSKTNRLFPAKTTIISSIVVDTRVPQSQWNLDKCDGNGESGYILNLSKMQMAYLDYSWYGAGKARFGFKDQNGMVRYAHEFKHNNRFLKAYMRSGNMPCRYEVENLSNPTYSPSISHWGTSVIMDGKFDDDNAYLFTAVSQNLTLPQTFPKQFYPNDLNITAGGTAPSGNITIYNHAFGAANAVFQATISSSNNKLLPGLIPNYAAYGEYTQATGGITSISATSSGFIVNGNFGLIPPGANVNISGASVAAYNGDWTVASSSTNSFTVITGTTVGAAAPTGATVSIGGVWVRVVDANTIRLYTTKANATTGTAVGVYTYDVTTGNGNGGTGGIFLVSPYLSSSQSFYQPLLSVRLSPSVDAGLTGGLGDRDVINRMQLRLKEISVTTNFSSNIRLLLNANLSNLSFSNAAAPSLAQILQHGSNDTVNNGVIVYEFRAPGGGGTGSTYTNTTIDITDLYELGNSILGGNAQYPDGPDILTIAASKLEFNTAATIINSKFSWTEAQA